jgi:two-component sensor histidine kinase
MIGSLRTRWRSAWHTGLPPRSPAAFLFAVGCVAVATAVHVVFRIITPDNPVLAPYYSGTLIATLVSGAEAGAIAASLGGVAAFAFFVPPEWNLASFTRDQAVSLLLFVATSLLIIWAAESYRGLMRRLRREEEMIRLLNLELVHRIKNMLAGVQAIVGQSLRDRRELLETVSARLAALGATNDLLVRSEWRNAPLRDILVREFSPYGLSRFELYGEEVDCPHSVAILLALIIHELTTNAAKYGALANLSGRIRVAWTLVAGRLAVEWVETGGPPATEPTHAGFGSTLLRSGVRQFQGTVERQFEPTGLYCAFSLMIPQEPEQPGDKLIGRLPNPQNAPAVKPY